MRRHELDPVSLTFGFAFTGLGILFLIGQADEALRLHWVWPLLLLVLGGGILLDVARTRPRPTPEPASPDLTPEPTAELGPDPAASGAVDNGEHPL
jgi:hypothetical protein